MHVNGKKLAVSGLLAAFSVVLLILAAVIETSSLFFIAAASFCVGIALREWGVVYGTAFYVATFSLGLLVAPEKMYCFTFAGMGLYLIGSEIIFRILAKSKTVKRRRLLFWGGKYVIFNLLYIPALFIMPKLLFAGAISDTVLYIAIAGGQVALWVYDMAHRYMQIYIWGKYRRKLLGNY